MSQCDVIIVGLGAMGSAAAYHLARRGLNVLGFDQYHPPHTLGSTHGKTRIIREAYFEHPLYVPLVRRAYDLWKELEERVDGGIYRRTGGLMLGPPEGTIVGGATRSAIAHGIPHERLSNRDVCRRFPGMTPPDDFVGLYEERAGLLFPEAIIHAQLDLALKYGADLRLDCPVLGWTHDGAGVVVRTVLGDFRSRMLVLAAGPWIGRLVQNGEQFFQVERQLFHWFDPAPHMSHWPLTLWEHRPGGLFATLPDPVDGLKVGIHHEGETVDPDRVIRETSRAEEEKVRALIGRFMPSANTRLRSSRVCLYTNTFDGHFVIDWLPESESVLVVSPCSGHGFKFSSAIGEIVADLVVDQKSRFDLSPFGFSRLAGTPARGSTNGADYDTDPDPL